MRKAFLILLLLTAYLSGCIANHGKVADVEDEFRHAGAFFRDRNYAEAVELYRKILKDSPGSEEAPEAKFALAVILAYYDNPQRNLAQALKEFEEFLKLYPEHKRSAEARNWRYILKLVLDTRKENEQLKQNIEQLKRLDIRHEEQRKKWE